MHCSGADSSADAERQCTDNGLMKGSPYRDPAMAEVYHRLTAHHQFAPPARDLVDILDLPAGGFVLDVGSGTGIVAEHARQAVGSAGRVVGIDAAVEMLRFAKRSAACVAAHVPGLPFHGDSFDVVTAGFVVSHFPDYGSGLADLARVCRPGGRVGMTAWGSLTNSAAQLWTEMASAFVDRQRLDEAFTAHIPWDAWFSHHEHIRQALTQADLRDVVVTTRLYRVCIPTADFLTLRAASIQGLVLREQLTASRWSDFTTQLAEAFRHRFGETVEYDRDVHFGVGAKPAAG
jgi:ubiquinone/menaquinone biosynthesis C-methylase UbiE